MKLSCTDQTVRDMNVFGQHLRRDGRCLAFDQVVDVLQFNCPFYSLSIIQR